MQGRHVDDMEYKSALAAVTNNPQISMASLNKYLFLALGYSGWLWLSWACLSSPGFCCSQLGSKLWVGLRSAPHVSSPTGLLT